MKNFPLSSFALHPQIKAKHANKESEKLTNHDTSGTTPPVAPTSSSSMSGSSDTPDRPANIAGAY